MTVRDRKQFQAGHSVPKGLMLMLSAVLHSSAAFAQEARVLKPDLAFHMRCSERDQTAFEKQIESYLTSQRFRVLNLARIQKEHGYFISNFHMIALDEADRILEIQSLPYDENLYAASLITKPPTKRADDLEKSLVTFIRDSAECDVKQETRSDNTNANSKMYEHELNRVNRLFREAQQLNDQENSPDI